MAGSTEEVHLKSRMETCIAILNEYSWLLDSYVLVNTVFSDFLPTTKERSEPPSFLLLISPPVGENPDFFTEDHMGRLPGSWRDRVKRIPLEEFYYLMDLSVKTRNIWPLSIICLRVLIRFLQLPRKVSRVTDVDSIQSNKVDFAKICDLSEIKSAAFEHPQLRNCFLKHVKPKKRYEILKMAATAADIANRLKVEYVVDVGSGLGHLSRIMAYGFNLRVYSVETQSQLVKQAESMDCDFEKISCKYLTQAEFEVLRSKRPVYRNQKITFNLTSSEFVKSMKEAFSVTEDNFKFGIIGLHPCGDLAAVLLRIYTDCSEAKFISSVGCCYHKLSTSCDSEVDIGFPLTDHCAQKRIKLSYEARALACHAIETYRERLVSKNYNHLRVHCYRAALENIINKNYPEYRKSALGNVKSAPELSFNDYCLMALKKLNVTVSKKDLESEETLKNLSDWEDVVKFYSLRLMLAPLIETLILLDRKIYLLEKGLQCSLLAAFDPEISPRNQLLISQK